MRTGSCAAARAGMMPPEDCITSTRLPGYRARHALLQVQQIASALRGARYALTTVVEARSYSRNSGRMRCEVEMGNPKRSNAASTRRSVVRICKRKQQRDGDRLSPAARERDLARSPSSASVGERRISPSALTRSARRSATRGAPGTAGAARTSHRDELRVWRPIAMVSSKPAVVTKATRALLALEHGVGSDGSAVTHVAICPAPYSRSRTQPPAPREQRGKDRRE